jgi:hypothetical protein
MIEVFKTNVREQVQAEMILSALVNSFPTIKPNFDLEDCDHVLRIEGEFIATEVIKFIRAKGHFCEVLN